ncbi:MAG: 2,4'-dihydroxyacetophenone dioxygenase family protein [Bradyrhizobium sp.]|uniref:2,4'-dihydroxyacetophenone dioxygenase family protein n=1 Tax=Bradyrhizobium sp. TaxID=376 RepID=UPI003D0DF659
MNALASEVMSAPQSLHRGEIELPFVPYQEGLLFQHLQVNTDAGLWVIRVRFEPGVTIQKHRHTGEVFAFTLSGSWRYLEYPDINVAGSYLFEPAGAIHTLHVPATNREITDVWFAIRGANLNLDANGNVEAVIDAATVLGIYRGQCKALGLAPPRVIGC